MACTPFIRTGPRVRSHLSSSVTVSPFARRSIAGETARSWVMAERYTGAMERTVAHLTIQPRPSGHNRVGSDSSHSSQPGDLAQDKAKNADRPFNSKLKASAFATPVLFSSLPAVFWRKPPQASASTGGRGTPERLWNETLTRIGRSYNLTRIR